MIWAKSCISIQVQSIGQSLMCSPCCVLWRVEMYCRTTAACPRIRACMSWRCHRAAAHCTHTAQTTTVCISKHCAFTGMCLCVKMGTGSSHSRVALKTMLVKKKLGHRRRTMSREGAAGTQELVRSAGDSDSAMILQLTVNMVRCLKHTREKRV